MNLKRSTFHKKRRFFVFLMTVLAVVQSFKIPCVAECEVYRSVKTNSNQIAITFDDGPHPYLTERILDLLDEYHAKATFFMVGVNVLNYPNVAREVIDRGHEVGNHTFSHKHLYRMNEETISDELGKCENALEELCEYRPHLFRPPEGAINTYIEHCSEKSDYKLILWSIDTKDWENKDPSIIVENVLDRVQPGDIILMHDFIGHHSKTPEALEILLPALIERGFEPVTVSRLLGIA